MMSQNERNTNNMANKGYNVYREIQRGSDLICLFSRNRSSTILDEVKQKKYHMLQSVTIIGGAGCKTERPSFELGR